MKATYRVTLWDLKTATVYEAVETNSAKKTYYFSKQLIKLRKHEQNLDLFPVFTKRFNSFTKDETKEII